MTKKRNSKPYDLEERTLKFARNVRSFVKKLPKTIANIEDGKQLIKSSGSVGANYIEANEALSKKDFIMRIKISRNFEFVSDFVFRASNLIVSMTARNKYNELLSGYGD